MRVHLHRQRQKSGLAVLSIEVSEYRWAKVLERYGLDQNKADDREAMAKALSRWLALALVAIEEAEEDFK